MCWTKRRLRIRLSSKSTPPRWTNWRGTSVGPMAAGGNVCRKTRDKATCFAGYGFAGPTDPPPPGGPDETVEVRGHCRQRKRREIDWDKLPQIRHEHDLSPEEKTCSCCGRPMDRIGEDVTREWNSSRRSWKPTSTSAPSTPAAAARMECVRAAATVPADSRWYRWAGAGRRGVGQQVRRPSAAVPFGGYPGPRGVYLAAARFVTG